MKVLLDSCVYGKAREDLNAAGHDGIWTGDWVQDPGDSEILATAIAQQRVLITLDKDFGEITVTQQVRHCRCGTLALCVSLTSLPDATERSVSTSWSIMRPTWPRGHSSRSNRDE